MPVPTEATVTKRNVKASLATQAPASAPTTQSQLASSSNSSIKSENDINLANFNLTGIRTLLVIIILACICITGFMVRLFSVIRYESIIHEFDPWFNYRATHMMVTDGFYNFVNWFDERAWYPLGRIVGGTVYPGLMFTSGLIHWALNSLNMTIHIREVCVFLAPFFSGLTAIATYFLTTELWNQGAGLFAAAFISIVPGYISRSVAGSYDNEGIAIFALMFTYFLWIKSVKTGSVFWSVMCALAYFYMVCKFSNFLNSISRICHRPIHFNRYLHGVVMYSLSI
jgi:dolichyl-diphosphooligosaccharide--protein glycosyltransferase